MTFASPQWLWFLGFALLVFVWTVWSEKRRAEAMKKFATDAAWLRLAPGLQKGVRKKKGLFTSLAIFFAIVALARPQWGEKEEVLQTTGLDVLIALDLSRSMEVEDVVPSRIKKSKHVIRSLLESLQGDRVGLVVFAGSAQLLSPLTSDLSYLRETLEVIEPSMLDQQGTHISAALETSLHAMERGSEEAGTQNTDLSRSQGSRVVLLISDGEDHEEGAVQMARDLKRRGIHLFVFGVGSETGAPIPLRDAEGRWHGYKKDRSGEPVLSRFRPSALQEISQAGEGTYWTLSDSGTEVTGFLKGIGALNRSSALERRYVVKEDRFQIFLALAVLCLIGELSLAISRSPTRSGSQVVSILFLLGFGSSLIPRVSWAESLEAYLKNKEGIQSFREGRIEEAREKFGSAQALEPHSSELKYNQALIEAEQGAMKEAAQNFEKAAKQALKDEDFKSAARSYYNQGVVLGKKEEFEPSAKAFTEALSLAQKTGDAALEKEIRRNLELLQVARQKQKQQQQSQDQKQDQKPQEDQQNQQQQQNKEDGENQSSQGDEDKKKDQEDKGENEKDSPEKEKKYDNKSQKSEFKSQELNQEDAERVLNEISEREKMLQKKLRQKKGPKRVQEKDW